MRLPNMDNVSKYKNTKAIETLKIDSVEPLEKKINIMTDKDKDKTIKTIERIVRGSLEYKAYIKYLKMYIDMTKCSFLGNVTGKDTRKISIEIHHEPFTLYDITHIVLEKHMDLYNECNLFLVAEEVMKVHYQCKVGLLPLSTTVHELVHIGDVFVPIQSPRGDFIAFLQEYDRYISMEIKDILQEKILLSKQVHDLSLLDTRYTYLDVDGIQVPQIITK